MKIKNLFVMGMLALGAETAMAQECNFYFANEVGKVLTRTGYKADGTISSTLIYRVDNVYDYPSGMEVDAHFSYSKPNGKVLNSGQMVARCNDGNFTMSMNHILTFPDALTMKNAEIYVMGDLMSYPDTFSDIDDPASAAQYSDGTVRIYDKKNKDNKAEISVTDREFVTNEDVTTPAGVFHATKVKYRMKIWTPKSTIEGYGYEWYAPNVGIVRTEEYNDNDQVQSYSVLTSIK